MMADVRAIHRQLESGRQWLTNYIDEKQQQHHGVKVDLPIAERLQTAIWSIWNRDLVRRAQSQMTPSELVNPSLNYEAPGDIELCEWIEGVFQVSEVRLKVLPGHSETATESC
jgi:hypothetical protein